MFYDDFYNLLSPRDETLNIYFLIQSFFKCYVVMKNNHTKVGYWNLFLRGQIIAWAEQSNKHDVLVNYLGIIRCFSFGISKEF